VTFSDTNSAVAVGDQGTVLKSTDNGLTWVVFQDKAGLGGIRGVFFTGANTGFVVGGGGIHYTHDGGAKWESRFPWSGNPIYGVHFSDVNTGTSVALKGILRTQDGGLTWRNQASPTASYRGVAFLDALTGWAVGSGIAGSLVKTTTGGEPGPVAVSAASLTAPVAPGSLASLVGAGLATSTASADPHSPPLTLGGIRLSVLDSAGRTQMAPLLFVSPEQINFFIPADTAPGQVHLQVLDAPSLLGASVSVRAVAPGLFAFADGKAAAYAVRIEPDGRQTVLPAGPITLDERPVYLIAYATGVRGQTQVQAQIGGVQVPVTYAGPAGDAVPGLDQVNIRLDAGLKGTANGRLQLSVDGFISNWVRVEIQ
jgi:uncharacterized protein (TIGR03437 family)